MKKVLVTLFIAASLNSCDRPECKNTNPVFDQNQPSSAIYKRELVRMINKTGHDNVRYWIDEYVAKDGKTFMTVYAQGPGLCAKGILDITNSHGNERLQHFKDVKGVSYNGAELSGLAYEIDSSHHDYNFIFKNVGGIID